MNCWGGHSGRRRYTLKVRVSMARSCPGRYQKLTTRKTDTKGLY